MRRRLSGSAPWLGIGGLLVFLACDPAPPPERHWFESFEDECDGAPCGWERSLGDADQARWVETIHPGEHGLRLEGVVTVRGPGSPLERTQDFNFASVHAVARCDAGSFLEVEVVVASGAATRTGRALINPEDQWRRVTEEPLTFDETAIEGRVTAVVIRKRGEGVCEVGELVVDDGAFLATGC